ncbi:MAG TPA: hypothetical protein VKB41_06745 [Steroidobacteraceae bacterium]|nr:hypothetical protein [Steroidobacteraceae bacterium]
MSTDQTDQTIDQTPPRRKRGRQPISNDVRAMREFVRWINDEPPAAQRAAVLWLYDVYVRGNEKR